MLSREAGAISFADRIVEQDKINLQVQVDLGNCSQVAYIPNDEVSELTEDVIWFEDNFYIPIGITNFTFKDGTTDYEAAFDETWSFEAIILYVPESSVERISDGVTFDTELNKFESPEGVDEFNFVDDDKWYVWKKEGGSWEASPEWINYIWWRGTGDDDVTARLLRVRVSGVVNVTIESPGRMSTVDGAADPDDDVETWELTETDTSYSIYVKVPNNEDVKMIFDRPDRITQIGNLGTNDHGMSGAQQTGAPYAYGSLHIFTNIERIVINEQPNQLEIDLGLMSNNLQSIILRRIFGNALSPQFIGYTSVKDWGLIQFQNCFLSVGNNVGDKVLDQEAVAALTIAISSVQDSGSSNLHFRTDQGHASLADTTQGGIWGNFDVNPVEPSALAEALKIINPSTNPHFNNVTIAGITRPSAEGDGTGFPLGFGDWWRS